jgi:putative glycosyltransferase
MDHEMVDVVYGVQEARKGGWFERWSGRIFYSVFNYLANIEHPRDIVTARIMSRRYVDALLKFQEREVVISCLWVITGFKQFGKLVRKHESSTTTYSISKKIEHAVNAITSFSEAPLRLIFSLGLLILTGSIIYAFFLALQRVFLGAPLDGWTSVMMSIWLLGGTMVFFLGVIGLYVSKIFSETKQRPSFIVRQVHGQAFARD